jgi:hypothetical protein
VPEDVQKLQNGNILRVSENGQDVAIIEIAGKKTIVSAATPEQLIERMVNEEDQGISPKNINHPSSTIVIVRQHSNLYCIFSSFFSFQLKMWSTFAVLF